MILKGEKTIYELLNPKCASDYEAVQKYYMEDYSDTPEPTIKKGSSLIEYENVNHPPHYTNGSIEVIDFIEDKQLGYHRGNAIKYICRAGLKNKDTELEDLKKARWYIDREIERLSK